MTAKSVKIFVHVANFLLTFVVNAYRISVAEFDRLISERWAVLRCDGLRSGIVQISAIAAGSFVRAFLQKRDVALDFSVRAFSCEEL